MKRWGLLCFHNIYEISTVFVLMKMKMMNRCFHFFYIQIQLLGYWKWKLSRSSLNKFFVMGLTKNWKIKNENESKKHHFFN